MALAGRRADGLLHVEHYATAEGMTWLPEWVAARLRLRHRGQIELSRGVLEARQRPMLGGAGFAWDRRAPGSSALIAASLALWGVEVDRPRAAPRVAARRQGAGAVKATRHHTGRGCCHAYLLER